MPQQHIGVRESRSTWIGGFRPTRAFDHGLEGSLERVLATANPSTASQIISDAA
jgi:hypothetical protein